ncbi:MaoC family dehydratase N-terminal domain-containing protein [Pseudonocardia sp. N23]|uniref:FAS1-like dehydratase domain-containing protein n=1 Tax=Pseudonocardia sp. N23 TaxID=1987376 RepID=UPI000C037DCB|nr:MaoC family dehydratase N-terminal domain-containing protein [Pseudonocardia sp. N23]GAY11889.1 acyl dehydratase [Pseudonocardia sp. N23]
MGTVLGEYEMVIERGKVAEFARATGSRSPGYFGDDAPIPPTFLVTSSFWAPEGEDALVQRLGLNLPRVLHGGQEFSFPGRLPHAGDRLTVRLTVESVTEKAGRRGGNMTFIVLLTRYLAPDGVVVAESRATTIERGAAS